MNGENLLTVEYERTSHSETVYNEEREDILRVEYNGAGQPTRFYPTGPIEGLNVSYDAQGRMQMWQRGVRTVINVYDEETGNLHEARLADGSVYKYTYAMGTKVSWGSLGTKVSWVHRGQKSVGVIGPKVSQVIRDKSQLGHQEQRLLGSLGTKVS